MKSLKSLLFILVAGFWAGLTPAFSQEDPDPGQVLATINGTDITLGHLMILRAGLPTGYEQVPPQFLFQLILDQMIEQTLLMQANEDGPSKENKLRLENEKRALLSQQVVSGLGIAPTTAEEIDAAYQALYPPTNGALEYNAAHILVDTKEEAAALVTELEGGKDFADLAAEKSTGPSGPNGGDLGWFQDGDMVQPFFDAVLELDVGNVSPPVQTQFGWHVIILKETREQTRPDLEDVRAQLTDEAQQARVTARIEELKEAASIERSIPDDFDPIAINRIDVLRN